MQLEAPRFEDRKALLIAGLRRVYAPGTMNQIPAQWQNFAPHIGRVPGQIGRITYGVCWPATDGEGIEYLSGVEVSGFAGVPREFTVVSLAPSKYAIFPHREHVSKLSQTIDAIFYKWLPETGHVAGGDAETPAFLERYSEEFDPRTGMDGMEVWVPLSS
jgi:AraC family transcriptional regulator